MLLKEKSFAFVEAEKLYESGDVDAAIVVFESICDDEQEAYLQLSNIYKYEVVNGRKQIEKSIYFHKKYIGWLNAKVKSGDRYAQFKLGLMYQFGDSIEQSSQKALSLIISSAEAGYPEAQYHLSNIYEYGWCDLEVDARCAMCWLDQAVQHELPDALYKKGSILATASDKGIIDRYAIELLELAKVHGSWQAEDLLEAILKKEEYQ